MPLSPRVADLTSFDLLRSVAELGSIGRAARAHGLSQPAASARLRLLEDCVGVPLLERLARGATLTAAGELVVSWARSALDGAADLEAGIAALRGGHDSQVRIAAAVTVAEYLLPGWLVALRKVDPDTSVALSSGGSEEIAGRVLSGAAEIGFLEGPAVPSGLRSCEVARDELVLVVAPDHPWATRRRPARAADLATTPLVSCLPGSGAREVLEAAVGDQDGGTVAAPLLEVSSPTAIKSAVMGGIGPAVLSTYAVVGELAAGALVRVPIAGLDLTRRLRAVWPSGQSLRGPARDLLAIATRG